MAMEPPPSRWKVVERGRRLEVIDTLTGAPASRSAVSYESAQALSWSGIAGDTLSLRVGRAISLLLSIGATNHLGQPILTTKLWYDDKGPRDVTLDSTGQARFGRAAILLIAIIVSTVIVSVEAPAGLAFLLPLALSPVQSWLRKRATAFLDAAQAASEVSSASDG